MKERRDKVNYYLDLAEIVGQRGTCLRRHYGAVIVKNDEVISTGYVGAPRGRKNCSDLGICIRQKMNVPRGERYELCRSVHAEANAIISASRGKMIGSTLYLVGKEVDTGEYVKNSNSCSMCKRMIINAGIDRVYIRDSKDEYRMIHVQQWIDDDESLAGSFGYEMDLNKISEEEKEMVKEQVAAMHEYYELTHEGLYYRLTGLKKQDFMAWEFVAKDQSRALLTIVKTDAEGNMLPVHTKVCGLAEDKLYRCSLDQEVRLGRTWNRAGLTLHQVLEEYESIRVEFTEVK